MEKKSWRPWTWNHVNVEKHAKNILGNANGNIWYSINLVWFVRMFNVKKIHSVKAVRWFYNKIHNPEKSKWKIFEGNQT